MELGTICQDCTGIEKCNKYCIAKAGENLLRYITSVDTVESSIGELNLDVVTKKASMIVSGHIIKVGETPTHVLSGLSACIDASGKFSKYADKTPYQILKAYLDIQNASAEDRQKISDLYRKFNSNKVLPVPIKLGTECEVKYLGKSDKKQSTIGKVSHIQWLADTKTGKITCYVYVTLDKNALDTNSKGFKVPISEYGETLTMPQVERTLKSTEVDRSIIKMNALGIIKPIVISDDNVTLVVDNSFLYKIMDVYPTIIGVWKDGAMVENEAGVKSILQSKAYKKYKSTAKYIERHRRFMAPYGLFEANTIKLK